MNWSVTVSSPPTVEPVTLAEARAHLRIDDDQTGENTLISALIQAAREKIEIETRRALVQQTQILRLDAFPLEGDAAIVVPNPPLRSVTSITYTDGNGDTQTLDAANYRVDTASEPGRITPAYNTTWPLTRLQTNAVAITFVCGYAPGDGSPTDYAENVPESLKAAIKLLVGHWFENREATGAANLRPIPMAVDSLIWNWRVLRL